MKTEKPKIRITPEAASILDKVCSAPLGPSKVKYASAAIIEKFEKERK